VKWCIKYLYTYILDDLVISFSFDLTVIYLNSETDFVIHHIHADFVNLYKLSRQFNPH